MVSPPWWDLWWNGGCKWWTKSVCIIPSAQSNYNPSLNLDSKVARIVACVSLHLQPVKHKQLVHLTFPFSPVVQKNIMLMIWNLADIYFALLPMRGTAKALSKTCPTMTFLEHQKLNHWCNSFLLHLVRLPNDLLTQGLNIPKFTERFNVTCIY